MQDLRQLLGFLLRLSGEVRSSRVTIAFVACAGILSGLSTTGMIALLNAILARGGKPTPALLLAFAALCAALPALRFLSEVRLIDLTQSSLFALRLHMSRRVLAAPLRRLETLGPPRLLATLTNDIGTLVDSLALVPVLLMHAAVLVSCLAYLGWLSWPLLLEISGFIALGVVTYRLPVVRAARHLARARERLDDVVRQIRAMVEGTKELKMHRARRRAFLDEVAATTAALQRENRAGSVVYAAASAWGHVLFFVVVGLLVLVLPRLQPVASRTLVGYTLVLFQLMTPLEVLLTAFPALSRAAVTARKVEELGLSLDAPESAAHEDEGGEDAAGTGPDSRWQRLDLVAVTHSYRREDAEDSFLLGPVDLSLYPGEIVFLVGGNGSGKTTLAKLLLGLYAPESGEIRLSGETVDDGNRERYREHFSAVFADFFVFERLLGLAAAPDAAARGYLAKLHLAQKVRVEGGRLSTVDLSQGQRKRLALLTAYLEDRPIYLFDEWAADQDPLFKEIFYRELLPELKARGKTVVVISHDDRYFEVADRVVKMEYGRIESDQAPDGALAGLAAVPAASL